MASSNSTSSNAGWIKVKNRLCRCGNGKKAALRVSETSNNPKRLFFGCDACRYFKWWTPDNEERESIQQIASYGEPQTYAESTYGESSRTYETTQFHTVTAKYEKVQATLDWLKFIVLVHTVLLGICIGMTLNCKK